MLSKQDTEFLQVLGKELAHQDAIGIDCQAFPQYWGIMDYEYVYAEPGDEDRIRIVDYNEGAPKTYKVMEYAKHLLANKHLDDFLTQRLEDAIETDLEGVESECEVIEVVNELGENDVWVEYERENSFIASDALFLTKVDAIEHLKHNRHGYKSKKAHVYAMTALRSPRYERLLKILANTDWGEYYDVCNNK